MPWKGFEADAPRVREALKNLGLTHPAELPGSRCRRTWALLFSRTGRQRCRPPRAEPLYKHVRTALEMLIEGAETVRRTRAGTPLRVQTYVTASIRWLARKLPDFVARHPDVRLQLSTCAFEWDFDESSADVGLVYCPGGARVWNNAGCRCSNTRETVCSPVRSRPGSALRRRRRRRSISRWSTSSSTTGTSGSRLAQLGR